jgi:hypothetical protein
MAGIQGRKDASGNIHVNLDSGTPCWNDAKETWNIVDQQLLVCSARSLVQSVTS